MEDALQRLDRLTLEEAHMASAELLKKSHNVEAGLAHVDKDVQGVGRSVQEVKDKIEGVDDKVDQVNREPSPT